MRWSVRLLCGVALAASGCDLGVKLGEQCYFGCVQRCSDTSQGRVCSCQPEIRACTEGLYCSFSTNNCAVPSKRGEPCGEQCEAGLLCRFDGVCGELSREDEPCAQREHCVAGLSCNWGVEPFSRTSVGRCKPTQGEGGPCGWRQVGGDFGRVMNFEPGAETTFEGCGTDLVCQPTEAAPAPETFTLASSTRDCWGANCAYPGTCRRPGRAAVGELCIDSRACTSGRCYVPSTPWVELADVRAVCDSPGSSPRCWLAPWPGTCIAQDTPIQNQACGAGCAAGLRCGESRCYEPYREGLAGSCGSGSVADPPTRPEACGVGLSCQVLDGRWRCGAP